MGFELTYNEVVDWKKLLSPKKLIPDIKQWTFTMVIYNFDVGQVINEKPLTLFEGQSMHFKI